jgi:hypothetical protein
VAGLLGAVVLLLVLALGSRDDDEASKVDKAPAATKPDDAGKRRPIDSGKLMLDANKASVSGTIRDAEGSPIAGASVCAQANQGELLGAGDRLPKCSLSERDGHYRLDGLWPVSTSIDAGAPQFIPARWSERVGGRQRSEIRLHAGEERREIDITLERGGVPVRGVVKDIGGGVVEDALVTSTSGSWNSGQALAYGRTDAEGRFELWTKSGQAALTAHAEGYAPANTNASAPTELATIFLTPESVLGGTVVHAETGEPVAGVTVRTGAGGMGFGGGFGGGNETITDADGRFRIASLPPGIYDLKAYADELYGEGVEQVHLGLSQSIDDIVVEVHPAFAVAGKVVIAETNEPCTAGEVTLVRDGQQLRGRIDEQGETLVRALLPGTYQVKVSCTGHVSEPDYEPLVVVDQSHMGLEWKVHIGLAIRGMVVDGSDAPITGVTVVATPKTAPGDPRGQQTWGFNEATDSEGKFELAGLLPGTYELDIWGNTHPKLPQPEIVTLGEAADVEGVRLVLPASGRLVGIVRDENGAAAPGVSVSASSLARNQRLMQSSARTGDDGRFVFERLEAGSFRVQSGRRAPGTTDDDIQGEIVEITAGGETEIELVVENRTMSIRGRVVDSAGAPVFDAFVDAARISDSAAAGSANLSSARASTRASAGGRWGWDRKPVLSDQDGNFEIGELAEGEYLVRAYRKGGGEGLLENVAAGSTGVLLTIGDTGQLAGKVVLAGGGSPDRFEIVVTDRAQGIDRRDDFFRTDGSFVIRELPPGNFEVHATASEGAAKTEVVLTAGQSVDDLALELTSKVTVEGRLVDADTRAPVAGMEVTISATGASRMTSGGNPSEQDRISDADGRFRVEGVQVGDVRVRISPRNFGTGENTYASTSRDLKLPSQPAVQDIGEIELLASRVASDQKTGDLGYTLMRLAPELAREDRYLEVAVIRPGGPAETTGLAISDRIVEVDGRSVTGLDYHRYSTLTRAPPGTSIVLGIEGGKQVTIVLGQPVQ